MSEINQEVQVPKMLDSIGVLNVPAAHRASCSSATSLSWGRTVVENHTPSGVDRSAFVSRKHQTIVAANDSHADDSAKQPNSHSNAHHGEKCQKCCGKCGKGTTRDGVVAQETQQAIVQSFLKTSKQALRVAPRLSFEHIGHLVLAEQSRRQSRRSTLALMFPQHILRRGVFVLAQKHSR